MHPIRKTSLIGSDAQQDHTKNYSIHTERAYVDWVKQFILFHNKRHLVKIGASRWNSFSPT